MMKKFTVYLVSVASLAVDVEAENPEDAIEEAYECGLPRGSAGDQFDLGDWQLASDLFPWSSPQEDVQEVDE